MDGPAVVVCRLTIHFFSQRGDIGKSPIGLFLYIIIIIIIMSSEHQQDQQQHHATTTADQQEKRHRYYCFDPERELSRDAASFADILNSMDNAPFDDDNNNNAAAARSLFSSGDSGTSSVAAAVFNFTNCIVGAGAIGLGGAMAASGGLISCVTIVLVAVLVKVSLDLLIQLSDDNNERSNSNGSGGALRHISTASYEDLGSSAFGATGKVLVMTAKFAYAFGCLVAYTVVIQDNFGPALRNLLFTDDNSNNSGNISWFIYWLLGHDKWCTWVVSVCIILPLCFLRDMTPLASASAVSIAAMIAIVTIIIYLWFIDIDDQIAPHHNGTNFYDATDIFSSSSTTTTIIDSLVTATNSSKSYDAVESDFYKHWFEIRWSGFFNNMGTFVFTFVCQHTVHLAFSSLKPELRNAKTWRKVSALSLSASCVISLTVGVFCYMTFWERTVSDIFKIYPNSPLIDLAKLLLCITMLLTFPLPFFTCRELLIVFLFPFATPERLANRIENGASNGASMGDLEEPLLPQNENESSDSIADSDPNAAIAEDDDNKEAHTPLETTNFRRSDSAQSTALSLDMSVISTFAIEAMNSALLPGQERQLKLPYHIGLTCKLWFVVTALAIAAPNLGDVLALVGCASGTLIAFVLPGLFAMRLQGYSHVAALILVVGGVVGTVGTICSVKQFMRDTFGSS